MKLRLRHYNSEELGYNKGKKDFGWHLWHTWDGKKRLWTLDIYFGKHVWALWIDRGY